MFAYEFPCGPLNTTTKVDADGKIRFDPPVYEQRYYAAIQILGDARWAKDITKIAEFGCAEMKLLPLLKRQGHIEHILQIDIDEDVLKKSSRRANPLVSDYLKKREVALQIDLLAGSIAHADEALQHVDAVVALELIEHVYDDVLNAIPKNIFGIVRPKLVLLSTPNAEFNVLFNGLLENGMRHLDHKFEWSRAEFQTWCQQITKEYANYKVVFTGVGEPPANQKTLGYVSQIAIFVRNDLIGLPLEPVDDTAEWPVATDEATRYKLVHTANYPQYVDNRSESERIRDEVLYYMFHCTLLPKYLHQGEFLYKVPITEIVAHTQPFGGTEAAVRELLAGMPEYVIEDDAVLIDNDPNDSDTFSDVCDTCDNDDGYDGCLFDAEPPHDDEPSDNDDLDWP